MLDFVKLNSNFYQFDFSSLKKSTLYYSKTSFLVQIKFITEDYNPKHKRILILN
jgi:hypothetical protein